MLLLMPQHKSKSTFITQYQRSQCSTHMQASYSRDLFLLGCPPITWQWLLSPALPPKLPPDSHINWRTNFVHLLCRFPHAEQSRQSVAAWRFWRMQQWTDSHFASCLGQNHLLPLMPLSSLTSLSSQSRQPTCASLALWKETLLISKKTFQTFQNGGKPKNWPKWNGIMYLSQITKERQGHCKVKCWVAPWHIFASTLQCSVLVGLTYLPHACSNWMKKWWVLVVGMLGFRPKLDPRSGSGSSSQKY